MKLFQLLFFFDRKNDRSHIFTKKQNLTICAFSSMRILFFFLCFFCNILFSCRKKTLANWRNIEKNKFSLRDQKFVSSCYFCFFFHFFFFFLHLKNLNFGTFFSVSLSKTLFFFNILKERFSNMCMEKKRSFPLKKLSEFTDSWDFSLKTKNRLLMKNINHFNMIKSTDSVDFSSSKT